jgi:hypothetical protein
MHAPKVSSGHRLTHMPKPTTRPSSAPHPNRTFISKASGFLPACVGRILPSEDNEEGDHHGQRNRGNNDQRRQRKKRNLARKVAEPVCRGVATWKQRRKAEEAGNQ